jgi:hypothetical protein
MSVEIQPVKRIVCDKTKRLRLTLPAIDNLELQHEVTAELLVPDCKVK